MVCLLTRILSSEGDYPTGLGCCFHNPVHTKRFAQCGELDESLRPRGHFITLASGMERGPLLVGRIRSTTWSLHTWDSNQKMLRWLHNSAKDPHHTSSINRHKLAPAQCVEGETRNCANARPKHEVHGCAPRQLPGTSTATKTHW